MTGNWRAVTETGTVYEYENGIIHVDSQRTGSFAFMLWSPLQSAPEVPDVMVPWGYVDGGDSPWREVELPVVGERLCVVGRDEWRISTTIVSLEELPGG